jgi:type IV pilus assembly protein PilN
MIRINLLGTERSRVRTRSGLTEAQKITFGSVLIMLLAAGYIGYRFWTISNDSAQVAEDISAAEQEAQRLRGVLAEVERFEARKAALTQRVTLIEQLRRDQAGPVHMLDEISRALPERLWLVEMSQKGEEVTIQGRTNTHVALADFIANLQNSQYFRRPVRLVDSQTDTDAQGELVRFTISASFVPGGNAHAAPGTPGAPAAGGRD